MPCSPSDLKLHAAEVASQRDVRGQFVEFVSNRQHFALLVREQRRPLFRLKRLYLMVQRLRVVEDRLNNGDSRSRHPGMSRHETSFLLPARPELFKQLYNRLICTLVHEETSLLRQLKRFARINCGGWLIRDKIGVGTMFKHQPNQLNVTAQDCTV
jgi:hypothetical protein